MQRIQGVVVGDYGVGKTSLLYAMVGKPVPEEHVPTLMESHMVVVEVGDGKKIEFVVCDTPGSDDHQKLTEMGLGKKDIVVMCFSLIDEVSYKRVKEKWLPLVKSYIPKAPIVLVGTKLDQRNTPEIVEELLGKGTAAIDSEQGEELRVEIGAMSYIECSARNKDTTDKTLKEVARIVYEHRKSGNSKKCNVM